MTVVKTVEYGTSRIGDNESPRGSNRGWFWSHVSQHWGVNLSGNPWCGAYVIDCALHGGLKRFHSACPSNSSGCCRNLAPPCLIIIARSGVAVNRRGVAIVLSDTRRLDRSGHHR